MKVLVKNLRHILRSHKVRSTFYTESALRELLWRPDGVWVADGVATEDNSIYYEIACSNFEAVHFSESKRFLKSRSNEHKISVKSCDCNCEKNEIPKHYWEADHNLNWDQKYVVDRGNRLIPRKIRADELYILWVFRITLIIYVARWWEKFLSKRRLDKHTFSWRDKLMNTEKTIENIFTLTANASKINKSALLNSTFFECTFRKWYCFCLNGLIFGDKK